jgi:deazaflavin-dependent oxidoreductase (nitroreductase family)
MSEINDWNAAITAEFRANAGIVGGQFAGATLLLLQTTGAKTKETRVNPLVYFGEDDAYYVFASYGGAPAHPDWYFNLRANPEVTVEVGTETFRAQAIEVTGPERDRIYAAQAARSPQFAEYAKNTTRIIPVIELRRLATAG